MPIKPQDGQAVGYVHSYASTKKEVGALDIIASAFKTENSIGSLLSRGADPDFKPKMTETPGRPRIAIPDENDSDYEPLDNITGYEEHAMSFIGSSPERVGWLKKSIDSQRESRADMEDAGAGGFAAMFAAGALDPLSWIGFGPGKALLQGGKLAVFAKTGAAVATGAAVTELALHSSQEERTDVESYFAIGGAGLLGGVLGTAVSAMSKSEVKMMTEQVTKEAMDTPSINPRHAGSAEVKQTTMEEESLTPAFGLEKTVGITPFGRVIRSESLSARRVVQDLAESNYYLEKNAAGKPTGQAVETSVKQYNAMTGLSSENLDSQFLKYRQTNGTGITARVATQAKDLMGAGAKSGKLTYGQFKHEISKALREGDTHQIPEVAEAAKFYRKNLFDPVKKEAIDAGLLPEDVDVKFADSYLTRVYNFEKMKAQPQQFKKIVTDWFKSQKGDLDSVENISARALEKSDIVDETAGRFSASKQVTKDLNDEIKRLRELKKSPEQEISLTPNMNAKRKAGLIAEAKASKTKIIENQKLLSKAVKEREVIKKELSASRKELRAIKSDRKKADFYSDEALMDSMADDVYNNIVSTPGGIIPKNVIPEGSPFKSRTLPIQDRYLEEFLENDIETVAEFYVRSTAPQIEMTKKFGDRDLTGAMMDIDTDYDAMIAKNPSKASKLNKERDSVKSDLGAMRDLMYGTYNQPSDPNSFWLRANRATRNLQFLSKLGGMALSSIPDLARPVMVHGLMKNAEMFKALVVSPGQAKMAMKEAKMNAAIFEMVTSTRANAMADIGDMYKQGNKFEKSLEGMSNTFGAVSLMSPWNQMLKQWSGFVSSDAVLKNTVKWADGTIGKAEKRKLAQLGIGESEAKIIAEQVNKHSDKGDVWLANASEWDKESMTIFRNAVTKDTDGMIVTPGIGDKPLFMSTATGKMIGQFKSFVFASHGRMLVSGLQQRDAAFFNGLMISMALGAMTYGVKEIGRGKEPSTDPKKLLGEAVSYSGIFALMSETNGLVEKATRGNIGVNALAGSAPMSKFASRNAMGAIFGPTVGTVQDVFQVTGGIGMQIGSDPQGFTERDLRALRRILPYQNLWYTRNLLNYVEKQSAEVMGISE